MHTAIAVAFEHCSSDSLLRNLITGATKWTAVHNTTSPHTHTHIQVLIHHINTTTKWQSVMLRIVLKTTAFKTEPAEGAGHLAHLRDDGKNGATEGATGAPTAVATQSS